MQTLNTPIRSRMRWNRAVTMILVSVFVAGGAAFSQSDTGAQLAELSSLAGKVGNADTRVRVDAFHRVWTIGVVSPDSQVKSRALDLLSEPVGSASDHIRMPAVYAIAEIANGSDDVQIKRKALATLREPMVASQLPIRIAAMDAVNGILRSGKTADLALDVLSLLAEPVRSGNNGVRIPAINGVMRAVERSSNDHAYNQALDLLVEPLSSMAAIGGMEVRLMAVVAVERIGVEASEIGTKSKAMGLLQSAAGKSGWEPEARRRAQEAASRVQSSFKR